MSDTRKIRVKCIECKKIMNSNAHEYLTKDSRTVGILQNILILNLQCKKDVSDVNVQWRTPITCSKLTLNPLFRMCQIKKNQKHQGSKTILVF